jgi:hypothetical protein
LTNPTPALGDRFGSSVAIDGTRIVVGAYLDDAGGTDTGVAHVFDALSGTLVQTLLNPTPDNFDNFGGFYRGVGISGDTVVVGAFSDNTFGTDAGAAYAFTADPAVIPLPAGLPLLLAGIGAFAALKVRRRCA